MPNIDSDNVGNHSVTAVLVTYNPDINILTAVIDSLKTQVESIIVIDNNSKVAGDIARVCARVECSLLPANMGLGKAHNLGIEYARSQGSDYVLLLDQDSLPEPNMVEQMLKVVEQLNTTSQPFCAIGSRYRNQHDELSDFVKIDWFRFARTTCTEQSYVKADFLISSGSLIRVSAVDEIGMMDESLFIDHVDTEWFMRAKSLGYPAYGCCRAIMRHHLGEKTTRIWLARWRNVPFHHAFRYYYVFRNSFLLYRRRYMPFKWMLADWVRLGQIFIFFGLFAANRLKNLQMIAKGLVDGIKGKSGRNDALIVPAPPQ